MTHAEFAQIIRNCEHLPPKHSLTGYIRSYAIRVFLADFSVKQNDAG